MEEKLTDQEIVRRQKVEKLKELEIRHNITCEKDELKSEILKFLGK